MRKSILPVASFYLMILLFANACKDQSTSIQNSDIQNEYFLRADSGIQTGGIRIIPVSTPKGQFNVWTKRVGNNPKLKVLLLAGGPGCTHEYFECFESFFPAAGIEFIYYDQLGCGFSDNPNDTALWDLGRYVEELEQVRQALNLNNTNCILLGHSWGGILAMEYALKYQSNIKGLVISNMMSSCPAYGRYADEVLAGQMPTKVLEEIRYIESKGDYSNPRYMELLMPEFYAKHICKIPLDQWPDPVNRSFAGLNQSLYVTIQGPSEFGIAGKLTNWDRTEQLSLLNIPVLTIGAKDDTMDPDYMKMMSTKMKLGSYLYCPNGSHMCFYDDQKIYFDGLIDWLKRL